MMERSPRCLLVVAVSAVLFVSGCGRGSGSEHAPAGEAGESRAQLRRQNGGSVELTLDESARANLAVRIEAAAAATLTPEVEAYGRVLDPSPFVADVIEERGATAALDVAEKELARSKQLATDQNVSARTAEAASSAVVQARGALDNVRAKLLLDWGGDISARPDRNQIVAALLDGTAALVRVDLPSHRTLGPRGVHFSFRDTPDELVAAELVGPAPDVDPKLQGQAFLALVRPNPAQLVTGQFLTAFLEVEGRALPATLVPRAAVVRTEGKAWVYLQSGDAGVFRRVEVSLDRAGPKGWIVASGVHPGDRIVVEGAQQLLSEEALATGTVRPG